MIPTVYLANWASYRTAGHHGPGRKLSIMSDPPDWATRSSAGTVMAFVPRDRDEVRRVVAARRQGTLTPEHERAYRESVIAGFSILMKGDGHEPGVLKIYDFVRGGAPIGVVADGDTLCCTCSNDESAAGRCHRVWASDFLLRAGWRVILDGLEVK